MEKNIMDHPYEHRDIIIDNESVKLLELVNPRQTRSAQVNSLLRSLKKDEHFDSLFVADDLKQMTEFVKTFKVKGMKEMMDELGKKIKKR